MKKTVWDVIKESKEGKVFVTSATQYKNLKKVLAHMDKKDAKQVAKEWREKLSTLQNFKLSEEEKTTEFDKLHENYGGFVDAGDDSFYMDFGNWIIAQGEDLYNAFLAKGHVAIVEYKNKHNIKEKDYMFECLGYVLNPYVETNKGKRFIMNLLKKVM